jgi:DNA modification methylase
VTPYYQDEAVTIYHGDCRGILPFLDPVDMAFADPPYGVGFDYNGAEDADPCRWAYELLRYIAPLVFVTPGIRNVHAWPAPTWMLAWAKPGSTRRSDLGGFNEWEPILMYGKRRLYHDLRSLPSVANLAKGTTEGHPCPKPLKLLTWLVSEGTESGQTVLDPFMGSGTTLRAAKDLGRKAIGIEIEERYCEIAARRMAQEVLAL